MREEPGRLWKRVVAVGEWFEVGVEVTGDLNGGTCYTQVALELAYIKAVGWVRELCGAGRSESNERWEGRGGVQ